MNHLIEAYNRVNEFGRDHGFELTVVSDGVIEYRMKLEKRHEALPNYTHGGMIAGLMDGVLGVAALSVSSKDDRIVATLDFSIQYLNAAKTETVLLGRGEVTKAGKNIIFVKGEIREEGADELIAVATGTFKSYPYPGNF